MRRAGKLCLYYGIFPLASGCRVSGINDTFGVFYDKLIIIIGMAVAIITQSYRFRVFAVTVTELIFKSYALILRVFGIKGSL